MFNASRGYVVFVVVVRPLLIQYKPNNMQINILKYIIYIEIPFLRSVTFEIINN